jgi:hypothetical protein
MYLVTPESFSLIINRIKEVFRVNATSFEQRQLTQFSSLRTSMKMLIGFLILLSAWAVAQETDEKRSAAIEASKAGEKGALGTTVKVIKGAKSVYDFGKLCGENQDANRSCFSSEEANRFAELDSKLDSILKQQNENQKQMMAALNEIYQHLGASELKREIDKIRLVEVQVETAAEKLGEYLCGQQHIDAYSKGESHDGCQITDSAGNLDPVATKKYGKPKSVTELYRDGGELPRGDVHGGLVARLVAATLGTWTNSDNYQERDLVAKGQKLMQDIAGDSQAPGPVNGILNAHISNLSAKLRAEQDAMLGDRPVFLTSEFLLAMNEITEYWVGQQTLYFSTSIAALQLRDRKTEGDPQLTADVLGRMTEFGVNSTGKGPHHPEWALDTQLKNYSVSKASPSDFWVILPDKKINRLRMGGLVPTFEQIRAVKGELEKTGIKISKLQRLYPSLLPQGENSAWVAKLGVKHYKRFQIATTPRPEYYVNISYYSPDPEPAGKHYFGEKYADIYPGDCEIKVRMWDKKPSMKEVAEYDLVWSGGYYGSKFDDNKSGTYEYLTIIKGDGRRWKGDRIKANSKEQYDAYVTNGAVPLYALTDNEKYSNGKLKVFGVGTLFQCNGNAEGPYTRTVKGEVVSIQEQEIGEDLWKKLVTPSSK